MALTSILITITLLLAFAHCASTAHVEAGTKSSNLVHVPITTKRVPASRLYDFQRRPWFQQLRAHQDTNATSSNTSATPDTNALDSNPIHGSITPLGEYYATLTFGGQAINVQLDTGSSTMAVPLSNCVNCLPEDHRLDLSTTTTPSSYISCDSDDCMPNYCSRSCGSCSSTGACCSAHEPSACWFSLSYADSSGVSGALVRADVGIATLVTSLVFGGVLDETPYFEAETVDGIFGLAYKALACNPSCVTPLFDALVETGKVERDIFSLCMNQEGGILTLGGSNPDLYEGDLQYVPLVESYIPTFYLIDVLGTTIGGNDVKLPYFTSAIVDSGTTLLVVSMTTYRSLRDYFTTHYCEVPSLCVDNNSRSVIRHPHPPHGIVDEFEEEIRASKMRGDVKQSSISWFTPGYCVNLSDDELELLPDITIQLDGFLIEMSPKVYMIPHYLESGFTTTLYWCLGIYPLEGLESYPNDVIMGDTVLQKYFTEYDRENSRIGFALAKECVDPSAVEPATLPESTESYSTTSTDSGFSSWLRTGVEIIIVVIVLIVLVSIIGGLSNRNGDYQPITSQS